MAAIRIPATRLRHPAATLLALAMALAWPFNVAAGTLLVCRTFDIASPLMSNLVLPAGTLFRDNGRADDPLAAFTRDYWQLRLETIVPAVMPPLQQCVQVLVRVTSDSSVKSVAAVDNRAFVYAGSNLLLDKPLESEDLLTLTGKVLGQVP